MRGALARFFRRELPLPFQRERRSILAAAGAFALGAVVARLRGVPATAGRA